MKFEKKELKSHQIEIIVEVDEKQFSTQKTISAKFDFIVGNPPYIEDANYNDLDLKIIECYKKIK